MSRTKQRARIDAAVMAEASQPFVTVPATRLLQAMWAVEQSGIQGADAGLLMLVRDKINATLESKHDAG